MRDLLTSLYKLCYTNIKINTENNAFVLIVIFIEFLNKNTKFNCKMFRYCLYFVMRKHRKFLKFEYNCKIWLAVNFLVNII